MQTIIYYKLFLLTDDISPLINFLVMEEEMFVQ